MLAFAAALVDDQTHLLSEALERQKSLSRVSLQQCRGIRGDSPCALSIGNVVSRRAAALA